MTTSTTPILTARAARRGRLSAITVIAAGALLFMPVTALAQVPGRPAPPPAPTPPPAAAPQLPISAGQQPPDLTQIYRGDDGGALYLRAEGTTVVGFAEHPGQKYAFVFRGTRTKNVINGNWYDVAKGTRKTSGAIQLKVFKHGDRLVRGGGTDFGPDVFDVIAASKVPWPGPQEAGFQARVTSDLDGAFVGKTVGLDPDGSRLYWQDESFGAIGVAEGPSALGTTRPQWVSVFFGKRDAQGKLAGEYFDVPKGTETERGSFRISAYKAQYGRRYGLQQFDAANAGLEGRPAVMDADYAIDFDTFAAGVDAYFRNNVVGFGYAISRDGKVVRSGGGGNAYLSVTNEGFDINQPFGTATQSDIASSSKLVVATAVMKELEARGMSIGSEVASYFPSCWDLGEGWDDMTFRRLLTHTSGLVRPGGSVLDEDATGYLFQRTVAETAVVVDPDTGAPGYDYDNQNYVMLGWILAGMLDKAKVEASFETNGCGKGTAAMLETMQIFEAYVVDMLADQGVDGAWKRRPGPVAFAYSFTNQAAPGQLTGENINPSGGLKMSANELGEFMAKLDDGGFVRRSTVQQMKDLLLGFDFALNSGSGLGWLQTKNGGATINGRGYGSQVAMLPGGVQVIGIWNSTNNSLPGSVPQGYRAAWQSALK